MNISLFKDAYLQRMEAITQPKEPELMVINALRFVMQNIFCNITNTILITLTCDEGLQQFWLRDVIEKLFPTFSYFVVQLIIMGKEGTKFNVPGRHYYNMILIDSFKSLERTSLADANRNSDNSEFYFIFLRADDVLQPSEMRKIFKYCFENYWINCNVMVQNGKGEVFVYTYFPFKDQQCLHTEPELINEFEGDRFVSSVMFPDKLKNFHSCSLKLTTWIVPPFVVNKTSNLMYDKAAKSYHLSGFEIYILTAISQAMNFTLNIDVISIDLYHKNQTPGSLPIKMLRNFETNITMGYFRRTAERDKVTTASRITYYLPAVAVILRKQDKFKSLSIYTFPFDIITWALIFLFFCLIAVLNNFNDKRLRKNKFLIFKILLGVPVTNVGKKSPQRIFFMTTVWFSFFLRSVYQSLLFYLFRTNLYVSLPTTIESLVAEGYKAVFTEMSMHFFGIVKRVQDKRLPSIVLYTPNEMGPLQYLDNNHDSNYAAITVLDFALYYSFEILAVNDVFEVLPFNVNDQQIGFYLTKHSYLVEHFNNYILWFQEAGLQSKYREWSYMKYQIAKEKSFPGANDTKFVIDLSELSGFFIIMLLLVLLASAVFLLELLSKKIKILKPVLNKF